MGSLRIYFESLRTLKREYVVYVTAIRQSWVFRVKACWFLRCLISTDPYISAISASAFTVMLRQL